MHRSVLQNGAYIKYAQQHTVEVISMEELERALQEKHTAIKTYPSTDGYGDTSLLLVEFPGLSLDDLDGTSNGKPIEFMDGNRIPYTAIVDPHTETLMQGIKGKINGRKLIEQIKPHAAALKKKHGLGVDRKLWERAAQTEVMIDVSLGAGELDKAVRTFAGMKKNVKETADKAGVDAERWAPLQRRLDAMREIIVGDLKSKMEELSRKPLGARRKEAKQLAQWARRMGATALAEEAGLLAGKNKNKK